jgi:hypothetical protein
LISFWLLSTTLDNPPKKDRTVEIIQDVRIVVQEQERIVKRRGNGW